ncbi:MAG: PDZ domain-containing protein, partial [Roseiflexaceae bacterium]
DYATLATVVGLDTHWDVSDDGPVTIGVRVKQESTRLLVASVTPDTPAADAGISPFDEIIAFNDTRVDAGRFKARLQESAPGSRVRITYFRRDELRSVELYVIATPWQQIRWVRTAQPVSLQSVQYAQWLGIPVTGQE